MGAAASAAGGLGRGRWLCGRWLCGWLCGGGLCGGGWLRGGGLCGGGLCGGGWLRGGGLRGGWLCGGGLCGGGLRSGGLGRGRRRCLRGCLAGVGQQADVPGLRAPLGRRRLSGRRLGWCLGGWCLGRGGLGRWCLSRGRLGGRLPARAAPGRGGLSPGSRSSFRCGGGGRSGGRSLRRGLGHGSGRHGPRRRGGRRLRSRCRLPGLRGRRGAGRWPFRGRGRGVFLVRRLVLHPVGDQQNLADAREHGTQRLRRCLLNPFADLREAHIESLPEKGTDTCRMPYASDSFGLFNKAFPCRYLCRCAGPSQHGEIAACKGLVTSVWGRHARLRYAVGCEPPSLA